MLHVHNIELVYKRLKDELFKLFGELQHIEATIGHLKNIAKRFQEEGSPKQFPVELGIGELYLAEYTHRSNIWSLRLALCELEMASEQIAIDGTIPKGVTEPQPPKYKAYITYRVNKRIHGYPIWFTKYTSGIAFAFPNS
jgi:hypothetical protein